MQEWALRLQFNAHTIAANHSGGDSESQAKHRNELPKQTQSNLFMFGKLRTGGSSLLGRQLKSWDSALKVITQ